MAGTIVPAFLIGDNMNNQNQRQFDILDILNILSFLLGIENLQENREQSAHNDVQAANDQQAHYLLDEINRRFEDQNKILRNIENKMLTLEAYVNPYVK